MGATLTLDGQSYRGAEGNISNVDPGFLMLQLSAHVTVGRVNHEATCNLTRFDSSVTDCGWCNEKECIFNVSEARYYDKISIYDYDPYGSTNFYIDIKGEKSGEDVFWLGFVCVCLRTCVRSCACMRVCAREYMCFSPVG